MVREKKTKSGPLLEIDFCHVFSDGRSIPTREPKTKPSTEEQDKYNREQAKKKLIRIVNENFDSTDILMHPTYEQKNAPLTESAARRDMQNYIRRQKTFRASEVKRLTKLLRKNPNDKRIRKNLSKLSEPFKYVYVLEKVTYKSGDKAGQTNWHFHLFMTGGGDGDRDRAEEIWPGGIRTNADRFRPEMWGPEAAARYMAKDTQGVRRFAYSRNMKKPKPPKVKDGRLSKNQVEKLAKLRDTDSEYWEKRHKGYRFLRCYARKNPYNGLYYVSVIMYKTGGQAPKWEVEEWLTE